MGLKSICESIKMQHIPISLHEELIDMREPWHFNKKIEVGRNQYPQEARIIHYGKNKNVSSAILHYKIKS